MKRRIRYKITINPPPTDYLPTIKFANSKLQMKKILFQYQLRGGEGQRQFMLSGPGYITGWRIDWTAKLWVMEPLDSFAHDIMTDFYRHEKKRKK